MLLSTSTAMRELLSVFSIFFFFAAANAHPIDRAFTGGIVKSEEMVVRDTAPEPLQQLETVTMISSMPTTTITPSSTPSTVVTPTPKSTTTAPTSMENNQSPVSSGLTTPQLAGVISGGAVVFISIVALVVFCLHRRRKIAAAEKKASERQMKQTKSLEFLTCNLEASSNPWNFSPVNTVKPVELITGKNSKKSQGPKPPPELPPFQTERRTSILEIVNAANKNTNSPIIPAATVPTVNESPAVPKPVMQKRRSSINQVMRRMSATFASIVTSSPSFKHGVHKDQNDINGTFGARNTPSPWAWGNSINGRSPVTPVDYLGKDKWDSDVDSNHLSKEIEVDELVGVAITDRERTFSMIPANGAIPPPPNPPPTTALPIPPTQVPTVIPAQQPAAKARKRQFPTMTIPVPSATAAATANLATFALFHQSLCRASTVYNSDIDGCSPTTVSPASSTRYTYCEGMSPLSPSSPASHICATNHSSCVWSCSSAAGTPRSSRHTMSLYSVPSTPHRLGSSRGPSMLSSSQASSCGYFTSSASEAPPLPSPLPANVGKPRGARPGPLNLSQKKKKPQRDHLAGELAELPPSPRRLPEEIERVTREMRERQQEEVLRRLFGEVPGAAATGASTSGNTSGASPGAPAIRGRSASVATNASRKGSVNAGFGVYGGNWPERI